MHVFLMYNVLEYVWINNSQLCNKVLCVQFSFCENFTPDDWQHFVISKTVARFFRFFWSCVTFLAWPPLSEIHTDLVNITRNKNVGPSFYRLLCMSNPLSPQVYSSSNSQWVFCIFGFDPDFLYIVLTVIVVQSRFMLAENANLIFEILYD